MKKILVALICALALGTSIYFFYFAKGDKIDSGEGHLEKDVVELSQEIRAELKKADLNLENLNLVRERLGFNNLLQFLLAENRPELAGQLILDESNEYILKAGEGEKADPWKLQWEFIQKHVGARQEIFARHFGLANAGFNLCVRTRDLAEAEKILALLHQHHAEALAQNPFCHDYDLAKIKTDATPLMLKQTLDGCLKSHGQVDLIKDYIRWLVEESELEMNAIKREYQEYKNSYNELPSEEEFFKVFDRPEVESENE